MKTHTYVGAALDEMARKGGEITERRHYRMEAYFNATFPVFAGDTERLKEKYGEDGFQRHIANVFATRGDPFFGGWREGDPLVKSEMTFEGDFRAPIDAAEYVFYKMNQDDRPNGQGERSLSVGDVVRVQGGEVDFWLAVDNAGFRADLNSIGMGPDGINVIEREET